MKPTIPRIQPPTQPPWALIFILLLCLSPGCSANPKKKGDEASFPNNLGLEQGDINAVKKPNATRDTGDKPKKASPAASGTEKPKPQADPDVEKAMKDAEEVVNPAADRPAKTGSSQEVTDPETKRAMRDAAEVLKKQPTTERAPSPKPSNTDPEVEKALRDASEILSEPTPRR